MKKTILVGISGVSGAGKTALTKALSKKLKATSLYWDHFDEVSSSPDDYIDWWERGANYEEFDYSNLAKCLEKLKNAQDTLHPITYIKLVATEFIIVDAPLGKAHKQTSKYIDYFIHLDTPLDIAMARRIIRDTRNGEKDLEDIVVDLELYLTQARKLFSEEGNCLVSNSADYILDGSKNLKDQVEDCMPIFWQIQESKDAQDLHYTIDLVDCLDQEIEKKMRDGLMKYERGNGVDINYARFSLVLKKDDIAIGVLNAYRAFSEVYIDDIWVDQNYRNKGLGKKLIKNLENRFRGKGFNNINLVTSFFQAPEFYLKCGFKLEFKRFNEKNPGLSKAFFVKFFGEEKQMQGLKDRN